MSYTPNPASAELTVEQLRAEVETYKEWAGKVIEDHRVLFVENEALKAKLEKAREALQHYVDMYGEKMVTALGEKGDTFLGSQIVNYYDIADKAREALKEIGEEK